MSSEKLSLDYSSEWQIIKELSEHFPNIVILVLSHTLIIKPIVLSDASGLVVTS